MAKGDFLLAQIAKLYYIDKVKQNEIAKRFNITPMMVSRYLREASDKGIVTFHIKAPWSQNMALGRSVMEKYHLDECIALETPPGSDTRKMLGSFFADYFSAIVQPGMIIASSWGKTISEFASALTYQHVSGCSVLQLNGAILTDDMDVMPTRILQQLGQKLNALTYPINAPLYVDSLSSKEMLMNDPINRAVWKMAEKADIAIFGASSLALETTTMSMNPVAASAIDELRALGCIGDLAGMFLDAHGELVNWSRRDLYMGIDLQEIGKAKSTICLAGGIDKAPILRVSAEKKLFRTLITTVETARAML
ncbi:MAG: sugar-binding transcriptional regulator [Candidatus Ventricola sp.]